MTLTGTVKDKIAILIDDMADTCGTLCTAAEVLRRHGATQVVSVVTHGILSGDAITKLNDSPDLSKCVVTNTVPLLGKEKECNKIEIIDISPTLAGESPHFWVAEKRRVAHGGLQRLVDGRITGKVSLFFSRIRHDELTRDLFQYI